MQDDELGIAAMSGDVEQTRKLLDSGASPNATFLERPLLLALCNERLRSGSNRIGDVVSLLIERGAQLDATDLAGRRAIHVAALERTTDTLPVLISAGADLTLLDGEGLLPTEIAIHNRRPHALRCLLDAEAPLPEGATGEKYWLDLLVDEKSAQGTADIFACRRVVLSSRLAGNLDAAMTVDDAPETPRISSGPSPL